MNQSRTANLNGCIWCNRTPRTKEHLWPEWYRRIFPKSENKHEHFRLTTKFTDEAVYINPTVRQRAGAPSSIQLKVVCAQCNQTWMSEIENKSKNVLAPMMLGIKQSLNQDEIQIIKEWIALKTIIGEYDDPNAITIRREAAQAFYETKELVDDWQIWIARYCGKEWITRRRHNTFFVGKKEDAARLSAIKMNTQSTTMVGGQLFILAISTSSGDLGRLDLKTAFGDAIFQIHPQPDLNSNWPTKEMLGDDGAEFFANILNGIMKTNATDQTNTAKGTP